MPNEKQHHFFISSTFGFRTGNNLPELIEQQIKDDGHGKRAKKSGLKAPWFRVYVVPLPSKSHYLIDEYKPDVEGTEPLFMHRYDSGISTANNALVY